MAVDKKTLLREALKQVQAGKIDKAVETYKAIVKIDPRDAAVHNTLGDLLAKMGKKKEAIAEFLEVAAMYEKDGFAARAIAMCQKAINLDPEMIAVRIKLGDLNASLKLPAEGRAHYMQAADLLRKEGRSRQRARNLPQDRQPRPRQPAGAGETRRHVREAEIPRQGGRGVRPRRPGLRRQEGDGHRRAALRPGLQDFPGQQRGAAAAGRFLRPAPGLVGRGRPAGNAGREGLARHRPAGALRRGAHPRQPPAGRREGARGRPGARAELGVGQPRARPGLPQGRRHREGERGAQPLRERAPGREPARTGRVAAARDGGGRPRRRQDLPARPGGRPEARRQGGDREGLPQARRGLREEEPRPQRHGGARKISRDQPGRRGGDPASGAAAGPDAGAEGRGAPAAAPPSATAEGRGAATASGGRGRRRDQPGGGLPRPRRRSRGRRGVADRDRGRGRGRGARAPELASVAQALASVRQGAPGKASEFLEEHLGRNPDDVEAWQALIEARRHLGEQPRRSGRPPSPGQPASPRRAVRGGPCRLQGGARRGSAQRGSGARARRPHRRGGCRRRAAARRAAGRVRRGDQPSIFSTRRSGRR